MLNVRLAPASGSPAPTVVTVVEFSVALTVADGPPPSVEMTGASLVLRMVSWIVWVSLKAPSKARTMTS